MKRKAIMFAFLTAGISGISIFANSIIISKTNPTVFALIRNAIVATLLTIMLWRNGHVGSIREYTRNTWIRLIVIGAIGGGIPFALFFTGLSDIGALSANIIQKTLYLWVALFAVPFLHERVGKWHVFGYVLLIVGMFVSGGGLPTLSRTGTWLVLMATVFWAVEQIVAKKTLKTIHPDVVSWGRMVFGLPFLLIAVISTGKTALLVTPRTYMLLPLFVSSLFLLSYMSAWYRALSHAPATLVSAVLVLAPVVTAVMSFFALQKPVSPIQAWSFGAMCIGVVSILFGYMRQIRQDRV